MSPQDVAALTMLLTVLKQMGTWPFGVVLFAMVLGPWLFAFVFWRMDQRRFQSQEEKYRILINETLDRYRQDVSEIKRLYESNARLVMATNEAFKRLERIYGENISVISLCTQSMTKLVDDIEKNEFCPVIRDKRGPKL